MQLVSQGGKRNDSVFFANKLPFRLSLEAIVSALVVVLAQIIFNPREESSRSDLSISRHMVQILQKLSNISKDDGLIGAQGLCVDLYLRAEATLQGENSSRR